MMQIMLFWALKIHGIVQEAFFLITENNQNNENEEPVK